MSLVLHSMNVITIYDNFTYVYEGDNFPEISDQERSIYILLLPYEQAVVVRLGRRWGVHTQYHVSRSPTGGGHPGGA